MTQPTEGRTLAVKLKLDASQEKAEARAAADALRKIGDEGKKSGDDVKESSRKQIVALRDLSGTALKVGLAIEGGFLLGVKRSADFEREMSAVRAATHATAGDIKLLGDAALQAGKNTAFTAVEAGQAEEALAKAGASTADILTGGLQGALDLTAAGNLSVADSAEVAATAMTQFGLSGKDLPHVADVLAAVAGKAQGEVSDAALALKQGGLVAAQFGISLDDTAAALGAFASAGLIGSDAGTSFKTMLLRLAAPSKEASELMAKLGINTYNAQGQFVGLQGLAGNLQSALGGLTQEQRDSALATIFGTDAVRAANVLYREGAGGIATWRGEVTEAGYASQTATMRLDNLYGDLERLRGSLDTIAIKSTTGANHALRGLVQQADQLVNTVNVLPGWLTGTAVGIAGVGGAALLAVGGLGRAVVSMRETRKSLDEMRLSGSRADRMMSGLAAGAGRVAFAFGVLQVASAVLGDEVKPELTGLTKSLAEFGKTGHASGEAAELFGKNMRLLRYDLQTIDTGLPTKIGNSLAGIIEGLTGTGNLNDETLTQAKARIAAIDSALAAMIQSGHAEDAAAAFNQLAAEGERFGISTNELNRALPQYRAALAGATTAETTAIDIQERHDVATRAMNSTLQAALDLYGSLIATFDALNGRNLDLSDAQIKVEETLDRLNTALKESHGSLDISTEKGRAARSTLNDYARAAADAAQKTYDQSGSLEAANGVWERYIGELRKSLLSAGLTKAQVDALIQSIASMPTYKATQFDLIYTYKVRGTPPRSLSYADITTGRIGGQRWGGVYEHAQEGALRDARLFSPMGPARYAFAEPATGGEAFVPKYGDYGRSMAIMSHAASWYGAQVVPATGGHGGVQRIEVDILQNGEQVRRVIIDAAAARGQTVAKYIGVTP